MAYDIPSYRYENRPQSICKHCGLEIYQSPANWLHLKGASFDGYGYKMCYSNGNKRSKGNN